MTFFGPNLYHVKRGRPWKFPETVADVGGFGHLLASMRRSYEAVKYYHDFVKGAVVDRTVADFFLSDVGCAPLSVPNESDFSGSFIVALKIQARFLVYLMFLLNTMSD